MQTKIVSSQRGFGGWSTRDLLVTAVIGAVFGVLFIPASYGLIGAQAAGPVVSYATNVVWMLPPFFAAYLLRRPGAALLIALLAGLIATPFTPFGLAAAISFILRGICVEPAVALVTHYHHYSLPRLLLAGLLAGALLMLAYAIIFQSLNFAFGVLITVIGVIIISGALSAWIAKILGDTLARTGILSNIVAEGKATGEI